MKSEAEKFSFCGSGWQAELLPAGARSLEVTSDGETLLRFGRVVCGKFGELSALSERFRCHRPASGMEVEVESSGVIPFGCEYAISRRAILSDGVALMTTDVAAVNGGRVGDLTLETVEFPGPWETVEFRIFGRDKLETGTDASDRELYCGSEPVLLLRCRRKNGTAAEFLLGSDIWRHRASAELPGVESEFRIVSESGTIRLERSVLIYGEETEPEKRPWRFESILSWSRTGALPEAEKSVAFPSPGCFAAKTTQRTLREAVRKTSESMLVSGGLDAICSDAAHLERPGRKNLPHLAADDAVRFYNWANRQLSGRGLSLTLAMPKGILQDSVVMNNLGRPPVRLTEKQEHSS